MSNELRVVSITIMGIPIEVVIHGGPSVELEGDTLRGRVRCSASRIDLDGTCSPHVIATTLLHEAFHLIDNEASDGALTEAQIKALATGAASFLANAVLELLGIREVPGE